MTTRKVHADGLDHAWRVLKSLWEDEPEQAPTAVEVTNALANVKNAAKFLRDEQAAIDLLTERDE